MVDYEENIIKAPIVIDTVSENEQNILILKFLMWNRVREWSKLALAVKKSLLLSSTISK